MKSHSLLILFHTFFFTVKKLGMGLSEFESESLAPKAKRMDQATLQAQAPTENHHSLFKNIYLARTVLQVPWISIFENQHIFSHS